MAWSKLSIINFAFNILNKKSVTDLENSGEFAQVASTNFDLLYESEISGFSWRFATKIQPLTLLLSNPPIDRWRYIYELPSDYLANIRMHPESDFQIYSQNTLFSNTNNLQMEYRYLPDVTKLPAYFVTYFSILLAKRFALAVADSTSLASYLEKDLISARSQALFIDSQSHPSKQMTNNPVIGARFGGVYNDYGYEGNY